MASDIPVPRSYPQQLGAMIDATTSRLGIRRFKVGGAILSLLEAAAQNDIRNTQDTFNALQSADLDNSEGAALQRIGRDEKVPKFEVTKATGDVTISDTSFTKTATKVYSGKAAPIIGSTSVAVEKNSDFDIAATSGSIYIGRGTPNVEGPLNYLSKVDQSTHWLLSLGSPTTRFHNRGETVVVAQGGNRVVDAGTIVATAQGSLSAAAQFTTTFEATIPDGETEVAGVEVVATVGGISGNAPAGAIKEFPSAPFPGAAVTNPKPFTTGRDTETDNDYKDRIRKVRNSRQRGTDLAIENAVLGAVSSSENKRISSASVVRRRGQPSMLYIDDGSGYEEFSSGTGIETVIDSALGGETKFKALGRPVAKAFLKSDAVAPYALADSMKLSVSVGGEVSTHAFDVSEFASIESASAYEVVASINRDATIAFAARTSEAGTKVIITARGEENEDLAIVAVPAPDTDAGPVFEFPASRRWTSLLYKNDRLLSKDGKSALIRSNSFALWNSFTGPQTLVIAVDATPAVTYTWTDSDFIDASTGYTGTGKNSLVAWTTVINRKVPGITASVENDRLVLTSNLGHNATAQVSITGGSLVTNFVFPVVSATGAASDYTLDRATSDIVLTKPLAPGDRLALGTVWTRGFLETGVLAPTTLSSDATTWWAQDSDVSMIPHGVGAGTALTAAVDAVTNSGYRIRITASSPAAAFANVVKGDWAILYDPDTNLPTALRKAWRVIDVKEVSGLKNRVIIEKRILNAPRTGAACAGLVPTGGNPARVLVTGGITLDTGTDTLLTRGRTGRGITPTCELFDPATNAWTYTGSMAQARRHHTATLLSNGKVLVVGGITTDGTVLATTELYDPALGTWSSGPVMASSRADHTATLLASGRVLIIGGRTTADAAVTTSVEYDPGSNSFINSVSLVTARFRHGAVRITGTGSAENDNVFIAGGIDTSGTRLASVERYNTAVPGWSAKNPMPSTRCSFGLSFFDTPASNAHLIAVGDGESSSHAERQASYVVYNVGTNTWGADTAISGTAFWFQNKSVVRAPVGNGTVLALYGSEDAGSGKQRLRHKAATWNGSVVTWTNLPDSLFAATGVEKTEVSFVELTGTVAPEVSDFIVFCVGGTNRNNIGGDPNKGYATAHHERFNLTDSVWQYPDSSSPDLTHTSGLNAGTLAARGLAFVRTPDYLQKVVIPAAVNYTAPSWVTALNAGLDGITASVYKTSHIRVATNSFGLNGELVLAASDISGPSPALPNLLPLTPGQVQNNLTGHMASLESGSGLGTPANFQIHHVGYTTAPHISDAARTLFVSEPGSDVAEVPYSGTVLGLKGWTTGVGPGHWNWTTAGDDKAVLEYGNAKGFRSPIATFDDTAGLGPNLADKTRIGLRKDPFNDLVPGQPLVVAAPFATGPNDDLTVVVDNDSATKRFAISMFRKLRPSNSTYGSTVTLNDADNSNATLATAFGTAYDWNDFAIYMKSRVKSHSSSPTKRLLWRWFRHGAEGDTAALRYLYPDGPNADVGITTAEYQNNSITEGNEALLGVHVTLNSGAQKSASVIRGSTKLGLARVNGSTGTDVWDTYSIVGFSVVEGERTSAGGTTRLRIQVPNNGVVAQGPQDSGLSSGDIVWFEAVAPTATTLFSGSFAISSVGAFNVTTGQQDIFVPANTLHDGTSAWTLTTNPGTLSNDPSGEATIDPTAAINDLWRINGTQQPSSFRGATSRVIGTGPQFLCCRSVCINGGPAVSTPVWTSVLDTSTLVLFSGPTKTAGQIATAINALAGDTSKCPVSVTVTGDGTGVIDKATWDELNNAPAHYRLGDGLNFVQRTIIPGNVSIDTQFLLRAPVSSDLGSDADFANEDIRIAPVLVADTVQWLNTPAVTGLSYSAEIRASSSGTKVQIASLTPGSVGAVQVEGGSASAAHAAVQGAARLVEHTSLYNRSAVTISRAESVPFLGKAWVVIDNNFVATKPLSALSISETTTVTVDATGLWTLSTAPYIVAGTVASARAEFERVGRYTAIHFPDQAQPDILGTVNFPEGGYIYLTSRAVQDSDLDNIATANRGTFRILRSTATSFGVTVWIENSSTVEQVAECDVKGLAPGSMVAGDSWNVSSSRFGARNKASWRVAEVGAATPGGPQYTNSSFRVETTTAPPDVVAAPTIFDEAFDLCQIREGVPSRLVKRIVSISPNQTDGNSVDIQFDNAAAYGSIGAQAGSVLTALDKLDFPVGTFWGVDGYAESLGLIAEANRIVYGDVTDEATYPGFASTGATVLVSGPLVRRLSIALSLRVQSGLATADLADRVKSAVASVINQTGVGQSISISDIVAAAASVNGVIAVAVLKPSYSSVADTILIQANEKPMILNLDADIKVSFVGE